MGLFREPMTGFHGRSREDFAVALAVRNLLRGVFRPFAAARADRGGPARMPAGGLAVYAAGMAAMASAPNPSWLVPTAGLVIGLVQAPTAFAIVLAAFARLVPAARRGRAFGMGTPAGSLGRFPVVPAGRAAARLVPAGGAGRGGGDGHDPAAGAARAGARSAIVPTCC